MTQSVPQTQKKSIPEVLSISKAVTSISQALMMQYRHVRYSERTVEILKSQQGAEVTVTLNRVHLILTAVKSLQSTVDIFMLMHQATDSTQTERS